MLLDREYIGMDNDLEISAKEIVIKMDIGKYKTRSKQNHDKSSLHLFRQHLPFPHGRIHPKGPRRQTRPHRPIRDSLGCHQHRRNLEWHRESDLSAGADGA